MMGERQANGETEILEALSKLRQMLYGMHKLLDNIQGVVLAETPESDHTPEAIAARQVGDRKLGNHEKEMHNG